MASASMLDRFSDTDLSSFNGRSTIWEYSLHNFAETGVLRMFIGFGYNSAQVLLPPAMEPGSWNYHNEYLNNLMDGGIIGLGIFLAFIISIWPRIRRTTHPLKNVMRGWTVFLVVAGLSGVISGTHIFWLILGSICGAIAAQEYPSKDEIKTLLIVRLYRSWREAMHESVEDDIAKHNLLDKNATV